MANSKNILTDLDLNQNELKEAAIDNLAAAPSTPVAGQVYFNTTDNKFWGWDGSSWIDLTALVLGGVANDTTDDTLDLINNALTVNLVTQTTDGAMSAADKSKLDALLGAKAGKTTGASFVGPGNREATVAFTTAFPDANYSVSFTGTIDVRHFTIESITASGFTINSNSGSAVTGDVYWTATAHGES